MHRRTMGRERNSDTSSATPEFEDPGLRAWQSPYVERDVPRQIWAEIIELRWLRTRVSHRSVSPNRQSGGLTSIRRTFGMHILHGEEGKSKKAPGGAELQRTGLCPVV